MNVFKIAALTLGGLVAVAGLSRAARAEVGPLRMRSGVDTALTVAAGTSFVSIELFRRHLLAKACRWCDVGADGGDGLNDLDRALRRKLVWKDTSAANAGSNVALYGGAMGATLGLGALASVADGQGANAGADAMIVAETAFMAVTVNSIAKLAFQRQRPYAHAASLLKDGVFKPSGADNLSFFSGHTTLAFSLAVSAGTISSMRGYRLAPLVWGVGLASALTTGYLRVAADRHYVSDVLVGAAVGSLFGFAVPFFHGNRTTAAGPVNAPVTPAASVVSFSGTF